MLCGMAAFKEHRAFGFWKGSQVVDASGRSVEEAAGRFGRITKLSDLPSRKVLSGYVKAAMKLNETGVKAPPRPKPKAKQELVVPADLNAALKKYKSARTTFENFSPSHRREYVEWPHRGQIGGHPDPKTGHRDRMDVGREVPPLEVHQKVKDCSWADRWFEAEATA